ncbi:MAG: DUF6602 domain-containing protein [Bryobacteraceae bacterium]
MPRPKDSRKLDLAEVFRRVQVQMISELAVGGMFEHASAAGAANEQNWLALFRRHLPKRYRVAPAFVIDADGRRSRQIDIAIFDALHSPLLFPHESGLHIPVESVYAVFEVKPTISKQFLRDAAAKAASVRELRRTKLGGTNAESGDRRDGSDDSSRPIAMPILAGLLATGSVWSRETFAANLRNALRPPESVPGELAPLLEQYRLDLGCSLAHGSFELLGVPTRRRPIPEVRVSTDDEALIFFMLRLLDRLRALGDAAHADLMEYGSALESLRPPWGGPSGRQAERRLGLSPK